MAQNFLPATDAGMLAWSSNFNTLINDSATTYGLTAAQAAAYTATQQAYADAYQAAFDPETRTRPKIEQKKQAKAALTSLTREYVRIIQANPTVTDAQRLALKITVPKPRKPIGAPTSRPGVDIVGATMYSLTIGVHDSDAPAKRSKPAGAVCAWVYTYAGESYPSDPGLWEFVGSTTRGTHEITLPQSLPAGQQIWVTAAWVSAKQEAGPVAFPISTNIQGGGSSTATKMKLAA